MLMLGHEPCQQKYHLKLMVENYTLHHYHHTVQRMFTEPGMLVSSHEMWDPGWLHGPSNHVTRVTKEASIYINYMTGSKLLECISSVFMNTVHTRQGRCKVGQKCTPSIINCCEKICGYNVYLCLSLGQKVKYSFVQKKVITCTTSYIQLTCHLSLAQLVWSATYWTEESTENTEGWESRQGPELRQAKGI